MQASFALPVNIRQTATTAANALVWAKRNKSPNKAIYLRRVTLNAVFDGVAAVSTSAYQLVRISGADPSAGTNLTVLGVNTGGATPAIASSVTYAQFLDTGLTVAGVTIGAPFGVVGAPRAPGSIAQLPIEWGEPNDARSRFLLLPGEGLGIQLGATAVVGDGLQGGIEWFEI